MISDKWAKIFSLGTETQSYSQLQKKADMEVAEIGLDGIKKKYVLLAPLVHAMFIDTFFQHTEHHLGHEHRHGVLVDAVPDTHERMSRHQSLDGKECRFR